MCSLVLAVSVIHNGFCTRSEIACLQKIGDSDVFSSGLKTLVGAAPLNQDFVDDNRMSLFELFANAMQEKCRLAEWNAIADAETIRVPFVLYEKKYEFTIHTNELFNHVRGMKSSFWVIDNSNFKPGDTVDENYKNTITGWYYSDMCSDYYTAGNIDDDMAVNKAGQQAFNKDEEYFLDMPVGKGCQGFPGLVVQDRGFLRSDGMLVEYNNYRVAREKFKTFVEGLQGTQCLGLTAYLVSVDYNKNTDGEIDDGGFVPKKCAIKKMTVMADPVVIDK